MLKYFFAIIITFTTTCTHTDTKPRQKNSAGSGSTPLKKSRVAPKEIEPQCTALDKTLWVGYQAGGFMITNFTKPCTNGYLEGSEWTTMGVPCTQNPGKVIIKGRSYAPKLVGFPITLDCKTLPSESKVIIPLAKEKFNLSENEPFLAHTPMQVVYWQVPKYQSQGRGHMIQLTNRESLTAGWQELLEGEPMKVILYGKESSWISTHKVYKFEVTLTINHSRQFRLKVINGEELSNEDLKNIKAGCSGRLCPKFD